MDLGLDVVVASGELEIVSSRMEHVWDALCRACGTLGLTVATGGDEVFRDRVLAWIIEPASKLDSLRVLAEAGIGPACHATLKRRLPVHAEPSWRQRLAAACAGTRRWDRPLWSSATCPRSMSKPMPVTGSASRGFSKERRADRHGSRLIPSGRCRPSVAAIHLVLQIARHGRACSDSAGGGTDDRAV